MPSYLYRGFTLDQWRTAGRAKLDAQRSLVMRDLRYYNGQFALTYIPGSNRDVFRRLLSETATNWCELVVNAVAERLLVVGFNFGDQATNDLSWLIWQDNAMDADAEMAQGDALACGHSFIGVWPDDNRVTGVRIDIEHASQVTAFYAPGTRREPIAVFKSFGQDDPSRVIETGPLSNTRVDVLITPDRVQTWTGDDRATFEPNLVGAVPYVELVPAPSTVGPPRSELHSARSIQDRIHTTIYNRMVATDFGAFRQITASGITLARDASGAYVEPFNVGADRLLASESPDARFGVIPESNLDGYLNATQADVMHLAAITQTPPHYLLGQIVNASGDALKAAETGLVSKVARRAAHIGEGWEQVQRLALGYVGNPGTANVQAEVIWRDFETRSEGQLMDALVKAQTLGVPESYLWRRWGVSPQEASQWASARAAAGPMPFPAPGTGSPAASTTGPS